MIQPRIHLSTTPDEAAAGNPWASRFLIPVCTLRCEGTPPRAVATVGESVIRQWDDPLAALQWMSQTFWPGPGRWIGFLSYDLGRSFEKLPTIARDDLGLPQFIFTYCRPAFDRSYLPEPRYEKCQVPPAANFTRKGYETAVRRAIDYIAAGDLFQVNLSQRLTRGLTRDPLEIHQRLIRDAPANYGAYLAYEDFALISNSPELFFHVTPDRRIITRPIKGTRPRLPGMEEELRHSLKDQAELNMIVDLERNDLGRICQIGSVKVSQPRAIETHPTVYHGVATIEGQLRDEVKFLGLLRALFPGGSVTGAPKIRAMEIIEELEPTRRGPYCGAIGWLTADGSMQFNVAIRTMIVKDGLVHIPVGGGIVADSDPAAEYEETLVKARAMLDALGE